MNTENIIKYNDLIKDIVKNFAIRYYNEGETEKIEVNKNDYRIIDYVGVLQGPVDIGGEFFGIDDILIAEMYKIPIEIFRDWNDLCYDNYQNGKENNINLYNYWRKKGFEINSK